MSRAARITIAVVLGLLGIAVAAAAVLAALGLRDGDPPPTGAAPAWAGVPVDASGPAPAGADPAEALRARGAYLARAGNCAGCHTVRGQPEFSGGRPVPTPFGTLFSTNLTSDPTDGIGDWTADDFWRALHLGRSRDGRLLYPAFPYTDYTRTTREDADAIFAYLKSLPAAARPNLPAQMRFPFDQRWLLALWRGLYFRPGVYAPQTGRDDAWNRGAYLVQGLGHCGACHTPRGWLGAPRSDQPMAGGRIPVLDWYAPGLGAMPAREAAEAGGAAKDPHAWVGLLQNGVAPGAVIVGPMAEVVRNSLQHLAPSDLRAISTYLQSLPPVPAEASVVAARGTPVSTAVMERGGKLYADHCADCHGRDGGGAGTAYPRLAGNRALTDEPAVNVIRIVLNGGFAPGTHGNPRPYGMPPFAPTFDDQQAADVISYVRNAWGNRGGAVQSYEVNRYRSAPPD
ncbi:MAG: cytochrome c [Burkholderiaceae bacterium]